LTSYLYVAITLYRIYRTRAKIGCLNLTRAAFDYQIKKKSLSNLTLKQPKLKRKKFRDENFISIYESRKQTHQYYNVCVCVCVNQYFSVFNN